jgi:hypothetical protein
MVRWINTSVVLLIGSTVYLSCSKECGCDPEKEATLVDYTTTVETDEFKVCLSSDTAATKDGVFYYTTPFGYEIYDCKGKGNIKIKNTSLDNLYNTVLFVNNGTLFVNHHKSKTVNKKYCSNSASAQCGFWVRHKEMYYKNGTIDTVSEIHYPHVTQETIALYKQNFEAALAKATSDKNFIEDPNSMRGFDYYGHAEDLFVGALNGDRTCEDTFRNYRALTKNVVAKNVYSPYRESFNETEDREFFLTTIDILNEAKEFKATY